MVAEPPGGRTDAIVARTVQAAAGALRDAGYRVEEVTPPRFEDAISAWGLLQIVDFMSVRDQLVPFMGKDAAYFFATATSSAPTLDAAAMSRMYANRLGIARAWSQFMADYQIILSPAWCAVPFEVGFDVASAENVIAALGMIRAFVPANLIGLPSACVPAGRDPETGVPIGVLLTGRRLHDGECLDAAEAIEARLGVKTPIDPI